MSSSAMNMLTAQEAIAQGSQPAVFLSIARVNEQKGDMAVAVAAREVAREIARLTGMDLGGRRTRQQPAARRDKPRNDNARKRAKPRRDWEEAA